MSLPVESAGSCPETQIWPAALIACEYGAAAVGLLVVGNSLIALTLCNHSILARAEQNLYHLVQAWQLHTYEVVQSL